MKKTLFFILFIISLAINCFASLSTNIVTANFFIGEGSGLTNLSPTKQVVIDSIDDFPTPSGDVITLENKEYILNNPITSDKRFELPTDASVRFRVVGALGNVYTYTGTDTLFSGADILALEFVSWVFVAPSGNIFSIDSTDPNSYLFINQGVFSNVECIGTVNTTAFFCFQTTLDTINSGITLNDNAAVKIGGVNNFLWNNAADTNYFSFTGTQGQINITDVTSIPQSNESIFNIPTTTTLNASIAMIGVGYLDAGGNLFNTSGIDKTNININLFGSPPVADSTTKSKIYFSDNSTDTVIEDTSVAKKVNATWLSCDTCERVTADSTGTLTYEGIESITVKMQCNLFVEPALGSAKLIAAYLAKTSSAKSTVTFNNTANTVNRDAHGLSNGTSIRLSNTGGALPAELDDDNFYFVINSNANDFQVSLTSGGAAVTFTDDGTGTSSYQLGGLLENSEVKTTASNAAPRTLSPIDLIDIVTGDELEVFIENETDANDITVIDANFIVIKG
jgi:hypothetical protein